MRSYAFVRIHSLVISRSSFGLKFAQRVVIYLTPLGTRDTSAINDQRKGWSNECCGKHLKEDAMIDVGV